MSSASPRALTFSASANALCSATPDMPVLDAFFREWLELKTSHPEEDDSTKNVKKQSRDHAFRFQEFGELLVIDFSFYRIQLA